MSEIERRLVERATIENDCQATADLLFEVAAALGELRVVATDAVYSLRLYRTALGECEAWIDLGLIERLDTALARLSPGAAGEGGDRGG